MLEFKICLQGDFNQINLKGNLDTDAIKVFEDEIMPKVLKMKFINVNLKEVPFVDSSGMGMLLYLVQTLKEKDCTVTISNVNKQVREAFILNRLPEIIGTDCFR